MWVIWSLEDSSDLDLGSSDPSRSTSGGIYSDERTQVSAGSRVRAAVSWRLQTGGTSGRDQHAVVEGTTPGTCCCRRPPLPSSNCGSIGDGCCVVRTRIQPADNPSVDFSGPQCGSWSSLMQLLRMVWALAAAALCFLLLLLLHDHVLREGLLAAGTCEIVTLDRDSSQPKRTIARQTARCACRKGQIAGTTRARPACVDDALVLHALALDALALHALTLDALALDALDALHALALDALTLDALALDALTLDALTLDALTLDALALDALDALDALTLDALALHALALDALALHALALHALALHALALDALALDALHALALHALALHALTLDALALHALALDALALDALDALALDALALDSLDALALHALTLDALALDALILDALALDALALDALDALALYALTLDALALDALILDALARDALALDALALDALALVESASAGIVSVHHPESSLAQLRDSGLDLKMETNTVGQTLRLSPERQDLWIQTRSSQTPG
ncbi:uncharacterized protein V6R79_015743 [Siganus canaliculatus]